MNLPTFFTLRFKTTIVDFDFTSEVECDDIDQARAAFGALHGAQVDMEMPAALIGLVLAKPKGCYMLDDCSNELLGSVLKVLRVGAEHFLNKRCGSYDPFNNSMTPADLGIVFPDGTMRLVWEEEHALFSFDETLSLVKGTVEMLLQAQEVPYFQETDDEINSYDSKSVSGRREELLFRAGLWPSEDNEFEPETEGLNAAALLAEYANRAVETAVPA